MDSALEIPDVLDVDVPVGGRVMVVADLHLTPDPTPGQLAATGELAATVEAASGPGVLVLAGNLFESLAAGADPSPALAAHPRLSGSIAAYAAGEGHRVIVLPGERDVRLASSLPAQRAVEVSLRAELAMSVELRIHTGAGTRLVRVEPGYRFEPLSSFHDPRNPLESPYAQHIRDEVLPSVRRRTAARGDDSRTGARWLSGVEQLDDVGALSRFIASRLVYRRLIHSGWLILVPVVAALILRLPATALRSARHGALGTRLGLFVAAVLIELLLFLVIGIM
ncbi:MAG TPA: hypothetical protein VKI19_11405, partial [Acidimicrobiales bacterium]|nr:hypothetical protein [Acidimicrobiales bacterium]